ncbi:hypothetical protein [Falsiphaeobacter marinintestinus]|uniref:hypothetical protein n=1 Tax=Falsiphaeobacter marinintestinus TaxID=1492905 RepID=UPI0011B67051|nr:hypothetical protein [Phaeobacter marinintestinus]
MPTKAELEDELKALKEDRARDQKDQDDQDPPEKQTLADMLSSHGVDKDQIDALWSQFSEELGHLPERKPLMTVVAAFGLGFIIGRMSK